MLNDPIFLLIPTPEMNFNKKNSWNVSRGAKMHDMFGQTGLDDDKISLKTYLEEKILEDLNDKKPFGVGYIPEDGDILTMNLEGFELEYCMMGNRQYFHSMKFVHIESRGSHFISGKIVDNMGYDYRPSYYSNTEGGWSAV